MIELVEWVTLPIMVLLLSELCMCAIINIVFHKITTRSIKKISDTVDKLDDCVKTIGDELGEASDTLHDLKDH